MVRTLAILFGIAFLAAGILGFMPEYAPNGMLLTLFMVNPLHNLVHATTGVIAFWTGVKSKEASVLFFRIFGVIYLVVAFLGFYYGDQPIMQCLANNMADAWLHLVIAFVSLYIGFCLGKKQKA